MNHRFKAKKEIGVNKNFLEHFFTPKSLFLWIDRKTKQTNDVIVSDYWYWWRHQASKETIKQTSQDDDVITNHHWRPHQSGETERKESNTDMMQAEGKGWRPEYKPQEPHGWSLPPPPPPLKKSNPLSSIFLILDWIIFIYWLNCSLYFYLLQTYQQTFNSSNSNQNIIKYIFISRY